MWGDGGGGWCWYVCVWAIDCVVKCIRVWMRLQCWHAHVCKWMRQRRQISTQTTVAKCIMYQNNESHLCLLTFWGCCLNFAALCINTHGFNNLGSSVVIDPVGHSPPFLISSSSAWGSAFPMSLRIYILQQNYECGEVNGHISILSAWHSITSWRWWFYM